MQTDENSKGLLSRELCTDTATYLLGHFFGKAQRDFGNYRPATTAAYNINGHLASIANRPYHTWKNWGWIGLYLAVTGMVALFGASYMSKDGMCLYLPETFWAGEVCITLLFGVLALLYSKRSKLDRNTRVFAEEFAEHMKGLSKTPLIQRTGRKLFATTEKTTETRTRIKGWEADHYRPVAATAIWEILEETAILLVEYNGAPDVYMARRTEGNLDKLISFAADCGFWREGPPGHSNGDKSLKAKLIKWAREHVVRGRELSQRFASPIRTITFNEKELETLVAAEVTA